MTIGIVAAAFGVLISAAAIIIPRVVNRRNNPEDHTDSLAYLKQTGRSAQDIARGNAAGALQHKNDAGSQQADGSDPTASHPD